MWVVALMIPLKIFCNIRSIEKFAHHLIFSPAIKVVSVPIQTDLPVAPYFFKKRYDCI